MYFATPSSYDKIIKCLIRQPFKYFEKMIRNGEEMKETGYYIKQLDAHSFRAIKELFFNVFTKEPWNDDWSDERQLQLYIHDLIGQNNSLTFGLFEGNELVGISMGRVKHWYSGTEYCIDEFCVKTKKQGSGAGTFFMTEIESACQKAGMTHIFLLTEDNVPAYEFYQKLDFYQLKNNAAFAKEL